MATQTRDFEDFAKLSRIYGIEGPSSSRVLKLSQYGNADLGPRRFCEVEPVCQRRLGTSKILPRGESIFARDEAAQSFSQREKPFRRIVASGLRKEAFSQGGEAFSQGGETFSQGERCLCRAGGRPFRGWPTSARGRPFRIRVQVHCWALTHLVLSWHADLG